MRKLFNINTMVELALKFLSGLYFQRRIGHRRNHRVMIN